MNYLSEIRLFPDSEPIKFEYDSTERKASDCGVRIYTEYKLSILLTDGLAAVLDDNIYSTVRGDLLLFRPDEIHFGRFLRPGVHSYVQILIPCTVFDHFSGGGDSLLSPLLDTGDDRVNHLSPPEKLRSEILLTAERLVSAAMSDEEAKVLIFFSILVELLERCREAYAEQKAHPRKYRVPPAVTETLRYINRRYADISGLTEIAANAGCSVTYLTRTFRRFTGKTVYGYLTERRLCGARQLLSAGTSVTDACYRSGFGDCSNFIRIFKASEGVTPLRFQKSAK